MPRAMTALDFYATAANARPFKGGNRDHIQLLIE
jgi:hypothetical protein